MSQRIVIDCLAFAREARVLSGELPITGLARLHDNLSGTEGYLSYHIEGRMSEYDKPQLVLYLKGVLLLRCQRCLEEINFPFALDNVLEFADDGMGLTQEEIEDDAKDFLALQDELDAIELIEDEILLGLPLAPRHQNCTLPAIKQRMNDDSPFAVLKNFKSKAE